MINPTVVFISLSQIFDDQKYMQAARRFADVIWERGLLRKGYGLCHGVSGNGYALLAMYQATGEQIYLWKAVKVSLIFSIKDFKPIKDFSRFFWSRITDIQEI